MKTFLSIGQAANLLGVSVSTMRRWEKEGKLSSDKRTFGLHRRYEKEKLEKNEERISVGYARVSSHDQKKDLIRQANVLESYIKNKTNNYKIITDLGSGLNFKKKGLKQLINLIISKKLDKIFLTHKDRLLRFGSELVISIAKEFGTEVIILNKEEKTFEMELAGDVLEIITVFSAKLYGKRSHKNKEKKVCT
jgi:excisionase family DNA binding protein